MAAILFSVAFLCGPAHAAGTKPASESKTLHEWATLPGFGIVLDPPVTVLTSGQNALVPIFYPFHQGTIDLTALLRGGSTSGSISVSVNGFAPGAYSVSAVTVSSSSTVVLGSLTVTSGTGIIPYGLSVNPAVINIFQLSSGSAKFGTKKHPFPDGFSPFDVATISLSDSNDNVVSTTTLTPIHNGYLTALSPVVPSDEAPDANGYVLLHADTPPYAIPLAATGANQAQFSADAETSTTQSSDAGGTLTLNGNNTYTGGTTIGGGVISTVGSGGTITSIPIGSGTLNLGDPGQAAGGTLTLSGSLSYTGGTVIGGGNLTVPISGGTYVGLYGGTLTLSGTVPVIVDPIPYYPPPTGRVVIHAHGLPSGIKLDYALDGTDYGYAYTDSAGNYNVFASQGGSHPKLSSSLNLFTVTTLRLHDDAGNAYLSAGF